jgi:hypothetical protein
MPRFRSIMGSTGVMSRNRKDIVSDTPGVEQIERT